MKLVSIVVGCTRTCTRTRINYIKTVITEIFLLLVDDRMLYECRETRIQPLRLSTIYTADQVYGWIPVALCRSPSAAVNIVSLRASFLVYML